jgi:tetratricopeptide (TPR) repeat protein
VKRFFINTPAQPYDPRSTAVVQILEVALNIDYYQNRARFPLGALTLLEESERHPPSRALALGKASVAIVLDSLGFYRFAHRYHREAAEQATLAADDMALGYCSVLSATQEFAVGHWQLAVQRLTKAVDHFEAVGHLHYQAAAILVRIFVLRAMGNPKWMEDVDKLGDVATGSQDEQALGWALSGKAARDLHLGRLQSAVRNFDEACLRYEVVPDFRSMASSLARGGLCDIRLGRTEEGLQRVERAEQLVVRYRITGVFQSPTACAVAEAYLSAAEQSEFGAERTLILSKARRACALVTRVGRDVKDESQAEALRLNGVYRWLVGDKDRAVKLWHLGMTTAQRIGADYVLARLHNEIGSRLNDAAHQERALSLLAKTGSVSASISQGQI